MKSPAGLEPQEMSLILLKEFYLFFNLGKDRTVVPGQIELNELSDPRKGLSSPLACLVLSASATEGLHVARQHPCMGKENGDDFSLGYVLLSFQNLTLPSGQPKADYPDWIKATPTPCVDWGKSSL